MLTYHFDVDWLGWQNGGGGINFRSFQKMKND